MLVSAKFVVLSKHAHKGGLVELVQTMQRGVIFNLKHSHSSRISSRHYLFVDFQRYGDGQLLGNP